ncbi:peptidoglycan binding domain-containing protein [Streptomyces sp. SP17BM10]|uniref:peptidoglycan binding domain-containing protein n=1 Tax=Streptomyces sp. SP17BM10 TaxID=3002530 RepID=UPI002E782C71|nr:peptidoglycan binding domain-containing protein [Streptomyces sp. SP17BM10]MEE1784922.1 peptidoglycan binding domain-containing protein [Streptomyces sp. SP17BM10]
MSSRESDNAHPTPRRTGPDAYPSGTPPYGTPGLPGGGDLAGAGAAQGAASGGEDEAPKTETTLTTRVRINIPGSRPIPPVVVRSAVKSEEGPGDEAPAPAPEAGGARHRSAPSSPVLGVMEGGGRTATPPNLPPEWQIPPIPAATSESESTGAWFRPRQKKAATAPGEAAPAPVPAGAPEAAAEPQAQPQAKAQTRPRPQQNGARPDGVRQNGAQRAGQGAARQGGRPVPAQAQGDGAAPAPRPGGAPAPFGGPEGQSDEPGVYDAAAAPFAADPFAPAPPAAANPTGPRRPQNTRPQNRGPQGAGAPEGRPQSRGPQGERSFPGGGAADPEDTSVDGFAPIREDVPASAAIPGRGGEEGRRQPGLFASAPTGADPFAAQRPGAPAAPAGRDAFAAPGGLFPGAPGAPAAPGGSGSPADPFNTDPFNGAPARPQQPGRDPEATAVTPLPAPAPGPRPEPGAAAPAAAEPAKPQGKAKAKGGAGKKIVKLGVYGIVGVLFLGAAAYGTGLMLNQSDIPKGTVVLGTDIGGNNRDQAIHQLDETVGKAGQQPLKLKIGDQSVDLDPTVAGLGFDTTATVDGLTQHSYSPVDVIKSLQGGTKNVAPEVKVDRAKLKAALDGLAAGSGQGLQEGFVKFGDTGDPVVVPGKAGQALDSASAVAVVEQAYRDRAAGKPDQPIALNVTAAQPKVSAQALQAAADGLGKSAVSGPIHITAGAKTWNFGKLTAAKALTLVPDASGKLTPKWDLDALNAQLGNVFDKVKIKKNGQSAAITAQDVADALTPLLDKSGDKDRTFKFTVA